MRPTIALAVLLVLSVGAAAQRYISGVVVDVADGKTLVIETPAGRSTVELQYIEVPTQGPTATTVREHLRQLALGKAVLYAARIIRDDRSAGAIVIDGVDMAHQMLRDGAAWHVPSMMTGQPSAESEAYDKLETAAKTEKLGIWAESGLLPPWLAPEKPPVSAAILASASSGPRRTAAPRNPRLGDTGLLLNGYDPVSRTGYLSTSLMGVNMGPNPFDQRMAVDISYYYKEDEKFNRTGSFVFTLVTDSPKAMFDKDNSLVLYGGGAQPATMPVAKRVVIKYGDRVIEKMLYRLDRRSIDRLVNHDDAYLKIRHNIIIASAGRYWLYTLLQVAG